MKISAKNVSIGYEKNTILHNLNFDFPENKTTAVMGLGGCGKTTLLKVLAGENNAKERNDPFKKGSLTLPTVKPSYLAQKPQNGHKTISDYFSKFQSFEKNPIAFLEKTWKCAPKAVEELKEHLDIPVGELPVGLERLAQLTLALHTRKSYIVLDEPEVNIWNYDEGMSWMIEKLKELRGTKTIIISTHHMQLAQEVADFIVHIHKGKIIEAANNDVFFTKPSNKQTQSFLLNR